MKIRYSGSELQTLRAGTVRSAPSRASARCAICKMEMQDAREISKRSAVHGDRRSG